MANHEQRAFLTWDVLAGRATARGRCTYGEVADLIGLHHRPLRYVLELIQEYCLAEKLPPLTIIVVNQQTGEPGAGFIGWSRDNLEEGVRKVYSHPWSQEPNPFSYARDGATIETIADRLCAVPDDAANIYASVRIRGTAQIIFRRALLHAYKAQCAMCGITNEHVLEAARIVTWSH